MFFENLVLLLLLIVENGLVEDLLLEVIVLVKGLFFLFCLVVCIKGFGLKFLFVKVLFLEVMNGFEKFLLVCLLFI